MSIAADSRAKMSQGLQSGSRARRSHGTRCKGHGICNAGSA